MHLHVVEDQKERLKVELEGETETITSMIAKEAWQHGDAAAVRDHPFMANPAIVIKGKNPKSILKKGAVAAEEKCEEFIEEFKKANK
jgi:DNA-directed RNA polymerase subunit L